MKIRNYPIVLELNHQSFNDLEDRISLIKEMRKEGVTEELFELIVTHINDGSKSERNEVKNIAQWTAKFNNVFSSKIEVSENHLKLLFNYLRLYHSKIINMQSTDNYRSLGTDNFSIEEFLFEIIIFKAIAE